MKTKTIEKRAANKNGIKRAVFVIAALAIQIIVVVLLVTALNQYAFWIGVITNVIATILVLYMYADTRRTSMKIPWIILILVYPALGISMYVLMGLNNSTKKMRRRFKIVDQQLFKYLPKSNDTIEELKETNPSAAGISSFIKNYSNYPLYKNTDVIYFDDAAKGLESQLRDLKKAEKFIFMEYFAIEDKESWARIEEVLVDRVEHGVEVRVSYDDMGSIGFIDTSFADKLHRLGILCQPFNPIAPGANLFLNNRNHRKITVIDGKVGYTGGYNLANEYFNVTHPYGQWKDTGIRLEGDAVKSLTLTFLEMWTVVGKKEIVEADKYIINYEYVAKQKTGYIQPYADGPLRKERMAEDIYINLVNKANRYCYFMTPYLILTDEAMHAIALAAERGVDVRIITPGIPDKKTVYGITRSFYHGLARRGVRIFEWTPGFTHAKMCVVDDEMATCGTINLDSRSLYHNFEDGCLMVNLDVVNDIKNDFDHTFPQCREVTEEYRGKQTKTMGLKNLFLRLFSGLL